MAKNIYEKIWDAHLVHEEPGQSPILYIDRHYVHEVTSPQAFEGLRLAGRGVRRPELTTATMDHNIPTKDSGGPICDELSRKQVVTLAANCDEFGIECYDMLDRRSGIVHVIGREQGLTPGVDPGATPACVNSCIADALHFGNIEDPQSNVSELLRENEHFRMHEELETDSGFYYLWEKRS